MKSSWLKLSLGLICDATMAVILFPAIAQSQPVTPANDGTGTVVDVQGNQFDIRGGSLSGDGQNLFHSFQQFGLSEGQIANFLSNPEIRNILGRVVGGDASVIHGLIQVTGGNSNLFLMNPAGIVFGVNARLNVPGDFTVTTATGIEFGNNWFDAIADNNYTSLIGTPSGYLFAIDRPGAIINQGNLTLDAGHNLTLLGGTVINTGNLSVPGGNITIAAVPGESRVRISHAGQILSLEISALPPGSTHDYPITPLELPQLLAGDDTANADTVSVNNNGEIVLGHSETRVANRPGSAIASGNISTAETESGTGGSVGIFGETVALVDSQISASGTDGGGSIRIGGGYRGMGDVPNSLSTTIDGNSVLSANSITGDGGEIIIWSDGNTRFEGTATATGIDGGFVEVSGKENLQFLGSVNVGGTTGEPGTLLLDPRNLAVVEEGESETTPEGDSIVTTNRLAESDGNIILDADNDITVEGDIEVETSVELRAGRSINLNADIDTSGGNGEILLFGNNEQMNGEVREPGAANIFQAEGTRLNAGEGNIFIELGSLGEVGNIELGNLTTTGDLTVNANGGSIFRGAGNPRIEAGRASFATEGNGQIGSISEPLGIDAGNLEAAAGLGGLFFETVGDVTVGGVTDELTGLMTTEGGEIVLNVGGNLRVTEDISTATMEEAGRTGNIILDAEGGVDTTGSIINATALSGRGGDVQITANDDMITGDIMSGALGVPRESVTVSSDGDFNPENLQPGQQQPTGESPPANGGHITLTSREGNIDTTGGELYSGALAGEAGNMTLEAAGDITVGILDAMGEVEGGNITLTSTGGNIDTDGGELFTEAFSPTGRDGTITITADSGSIIKGDAAIAFSPDSVADFSGEVILEAFNDVTINEAIATSDSIQIRAGRSIIINADIDTSAGNGNIVLRGNNRAAAGNSRQDGAANIIQESGTQLTAGSGNILLELGDAGEVGNIIVDGINTTGVVVLDANTGNIRRAAETSEIRAGSAVFYTSGGGIGSAAEPLPVNLGNLEATAGSSGIFLTNNNNLTIGGVTDDLFGIETSGGAVSITTEGNLTLALEEKIITGGGDITLNSSGNINTTEGVLETEGSEPEMPPGNLTLSADENLQIGDIFAKGGDQGPVINFTAGGAIATGFIDASGPRGNGGTVTLEAGENVTTDFISTYGETQGGDITITSNNGDIDTSEGFLDTSAILGQDGTITLQADSGSIVTGGGMGAGEMPPPREDIEFNAMAVADFSGRVILEAFNDVTISEPIQTSESIEIRAGRSIFINANIDTSAGNGNIALRGNNEAAAAGRRQPGQANIIQQQGTQINAGSGNILLQLGTAGSPEEVGEIRFDRINTTGTVLITSSGGPIFRASDTSLLTADRAAFHTFARGGIGEPGAPIPLEVNNLEAVTGEVGMFFNSPNSGLTLGGVTDSLPGIETFEGGEIGIQAAGDITIRDRISRNSFFGGGGNINIVSDGNIDAGQGDIFSFSANGNGGNVRLEARGNVTTGFVSAAGDVEGGSITIISQNGAIDTTAGGTIEEGPISPDDDVSSEAVATTFAERTANLDAFAPDGMGGDVTLSAPEDITTGHISSFGGTQSGSVTVTSTTGNVETGVIFSTTSEGSSGNISVTANRGDIDINHIATYSDAGSGGDISIDAGGSITINNVASFGDLESGDVTLNSDNSTITTGTIQTLAPSGVSGNIRLNTFSISGDIQTANLQTAGDGGAGQVQITTADGNVITEDITSESESGEAEGIDIDSGGDIETGDQTVDSDNGDASIDNTAGGDITTGDQNAIADNGDASIDNTAGGDITTGDQNAIADNGNASIENTAGGDITTGDQNAIADNGNASIDNTAGGDITTGDQNAIADNGNASIENTAGGDITTGDQNAIADGGDAEIGNETPGDLNAGEQVAIEDGNPGTIENEIGGEIDIDPSPIITDESTTEQIFDPPNLDENSTANSPLFPINPDNNTTNFPPVVGNPRVPPVVTPPTILQQLSSTPAGRRIAGAIATQTPPPPIRDGEGAIAPNTESAEILNSLNTTTTSPLATPAGEVVAVLEQSRSREFSQYLGTEIIRTSVNTASVRDILDDIRRQTGNRSAILYITVFSDNIELVVFTAGGEPLSKTVAGVSREELLGAIDEFRRHLIDPRYRASQRYLEISQQLYEWLIAPIASELEANEIDTLLFSLDAGLRSLPIAALHDGEQFLIETYSLSLIPSISLTDTRYRPIQDAQLLAMGASEFSALPPLPAVPVELETIAGQLWSGEAFLNQTFTRENLQSRQWERPYRIIHLATHAEFKSGDPGNSYIQLWGDERLQLDQLRELGWDDPAVDLLVLSACRTALGDENAELGFAGLAVQAGVKSALASLWYVSDEGTLALMTEFYNYLSQATIKAEALRQAQLAMLRGEVVIEDGELRGTGVRGGGIQLPKTLATDASEDLSHPYYWAGFTLIGSPW